MDNLQIKRFRFLVSTFVSMAGLCALSHAYEPGSDSRADITKEEVYRVVDEDGGTSTGELSKILYRVVDPKDVVHAADRDPARIEIRILTEGRAKVVGTTFASSPVKGAAPPSGSKGGDPESREAAREVGPSLSAPAVGAKIGRTEGPAKIVVTILAEGPFKVLGAAVTSSLVDSPRPKAVVEALYTTPTMVGISSQSSGGCVMIVATVATERLAKITDTKVTSGPAEIVLAVETARFPKFVSASLSVGQIGPGKATRPAASGEDAEADSGTKTKDPRVIISAKGNAEPVGVIRKTVESVLEILENSDREDPSARKTTRENIRKILVEAIDIDSVAALTLGMYRKTKFSDAQFKEFVVVFSKILFSTYISHLEEYSNEKIHIRDVKEFKTRAGSMPKVQVLTKVVSESGETPLDYSMFKRDGKWLIYDIRIEGVSLVVNYRSQFREILRRDSAQDLLARMEKKVRENEKK